LGQANGDDIGYRVTMSGDGNIMAACGNVIYAPSKPGYVRVFQRTDNQWAQLGSDIESNSPVAGDLFGQSISMSNDGSTLAIGGGNYTGGPLPYFTNVYKLDNNEWQQVGQTLNYIGADVAIADNGAIVAGSNTTDNFVQIFQLVGTQWEQLGNTITEVMDIFGSGGSLALSSDGFTLAVGDYAGVSSVKVFRLDGNTWNQLGQTIVAAGPNDRFGSSLSLSSDGKIVVGGARWYDVGGIYIGNARVFGLNDQNQWDQMGSTLVGDAAYDYFGSSVALSSNGLTLAVGANGYDGAAGSATGLVRVFQFDNNDWQQVGQDLEGMAADDYFGYSVAISADGTTVAGGTYDTPGYVQVFYHESNDE
jgi:hypothetical protein